MGRTHKELRCSVRRATHVPSIQQTQRSQASLVKWIMCGREYLETHLAHEAPLEVTVPTWPGAASINRSLRPPQRQSVHPMRSRIRCVVRTLDARR